MRITDKLIVKMELTIGTVVAFSFTLKFLLNRTRVHE